MSQTVPGLSLGVLVCSHNFFCNIVSFVYLDGTDGFVIFIYAYLGPIDLPFYTVNIAFPSVPDLCVVYKWVRYKCNIYREDFTL